MIIRICPNPKCRKQFDQDKNSIFCPHQGFPLNKKCKLHNRTNCGNFECTSSIFNIDKRKEVNG